MLLDFIIIGAQKCGTSFIQRCLREHPQVLMPKRETNLFEDPEYDTDGIEYLHKLFPVKKNGIICGIKRPEYLVRPEVPERILNHAPDARLIVSIREPVSRAISAYYYFMRMGMLPIVDAEAGLRAIMDGKWQKEYPNAQDVLEYGRYAKYLKKYMDLFPASHIKIVLFENLIGEPLKTMRDIYIFLGINSDYVVPSINKAKNVTIYSLPRLRFISLDNRFLHYYDRKYRKCLSLKLSPVSFLIVAAIRIIDRLFLLPFLGNKMLQLSPELKRRLTEFYLPDIQALEKDLGINLSSWKDN